MNENSTKRRAWVKNAIIIFLAIMLILTFFSNTIMNYSLPEVAAQYPQNGSITSKIRVSATVKANSTTKINIDESRKILSVAVKEGQDVAIGDVLFYLEDAESSQLKEARQTLENYEKQYRLKLLASGVDYYDQELAIKQTRDSLEKAKAALSKIETNKAQLDALTTEIKDLTASQKELAKQITAYQKQIAKLQSQAADESIDGIPTADRIAEATAKYNTAKAAYDAADAKKTQTAAALEAAEDAYEKANEAYEAIAPDGTVSESALSEQIAELNKTIRRYKEDYKIAADKLTKSVDDAYDEWVDADYSYNNALYLYNQGSGSLDAVNRWLEKSETARENYYTIQASVKPQQEAAKLRYDRDMEDYDQQLAKLEEKLSTVAGTDAAKSKLDAAAKTKKSATTAAADASEAYTKAKTDYTTADTELKALEKLKLLEECEAVADNLNTQSETLGETITEKKTEESKLSGETVDEEAQQETIKTLTQTLETQQHNLTKLKQENNLQSQREQIEIDELVENIEKQRALVEKYEANSVDAKITATIAGQVSSISAVTGSETSMGQTLCEIVATELGYSCDVPLTSEQAKRVRVGDSVSITNSWWSNIKANIVGIRNDPKNPGTAKIASVEVTGDVTVGQSLNLTIGEKGQNYDTVIPNSAIREDNNGKFVLTVEAKSSPLGNRYIAKRVDVTVLTSDDTNSAVTGLIGGEFIITTSTKPIASGNQVRMAENSK